MKIRHFGYISEMGPNPMCEEIDTSTCGHCGKITLIPPPSNAKIVIRVAQPCTLCDYLVCEECKAKGGCDPFEKKLERTERGIAMDRAFGLER